jgi:LysM repeat protein
VYESPEQSFRDHSDFLRYRDRYKFLFDLERTDYQGWAYGLKQAGYATDPKYAGKLIKYIEDYNLSRFDIVSVEEEAALPEAPHKIEEPVAVSSVRSAAPGEDPVLPREDFHFPLTRALYSLNGVPFVYAMEGESYGSLAKYYHLFKWEILRYNDVSKDTVLDAGTVVYLQSKKNQAPEGLEKYIVSEDGEDFHTICQRFGVKEKAILKLNGLEAPVQLLEGDEIKLR